MTATTWIEGRGVRVRVKGGNVILEGLAALGQDGAAEVMAYARQHKARLLEELGGPSGPPPRECRGCGQPFIPAHPSTVYCSARCFNTMSPLALQKSPAEPVRKHIPWTPTHPSLIDVAQGVTG